MIIKFEAALLKAGTGTRPRVLPQESAGDALQSGIVGKVFSPPRGGRERKGKLSLGEGNPESQFPTARPCCTTFRKFPILFA